MHDERDLREGVQAFPPGGAERERVGGASNEVPEEGAYGQARARATWACAQAIGERVLDVGCGSGMAAILMARDGRAVVGLDAREVMIEGALAERGKEADSVAAKLDFRCGDLSVVEGERFDTVVLEELPEETIDPVRFISEVAERVVEGGRFVIAVPFGLHPSLDGVVTFPRGIFSAVEQEFRLVHAGVVHGFLCMVADRSKDGQPGAEYDLLLSSMEEGCVDAQRRLLDERHALAATIDELEAELLATQGEKNTLLERLTLETQLAKLLRQSLDEALSTASGDEDGSARTDSASTGKVDELLKEIAVQRAISEKSSRALIKTEDARQVAGQRLLELENECADYKARLESCERAMAEIREAYRAPESRRDTGGSDEGQFRQELEAERARSRKLIALAHNLHQENQTYQQSIALEIGRAILELKSVRGLARFPRACARALRRYRGRQNGELSIEPLVLPRLELPSAQGSDSCFAQSLDPAAEEARKKLSIEGWQDETRPSTLPVMGVLDEFTRACFAPQFSLIEPRPDNWEGLLEACQPRLLLVESAWKGNRGSWKHRVARSPHPPGPELAEMVAGFKTRKIPTVFWNKEDPAHFNDFLEAAGQFDVVLTTAAEAVQKYRDLTSARVEVLQFAAEESLHNPIGSAQRNGKVCFAGSFYAERFRERRDDQLMLLDAGSQFDFDIFDRNHSDGAGADSPFAFPSRYAKFVRGRLPYEDLVNAYRKYRVFLNVNSVVDSPTMFSRRVFELLACGTPVVSTWSRGTEETFGDDLVWHVRSKEEAAEAIGVLMADDREWRRRSLKGIRAVLSQHTYRHRFRQILDTVGERDVEVDPFDEIWVVAEARSQADADVILAAFERQALGPGISKRLLLICHGRYDNVIAADVEMIVDAKGDIAGVLERAGGTGSRIIAYLSAHAVYGRHYLLDLVLAARYSGAAVIGKATDGSQYRFGCALEPNAFVINEARLVEVGGTLRGVLNGSAVPGPEHTYAADSANYACVEGAPDRVKHEQSLQQIEI